MHMLDIIIMQCIRQKMGKGQTDACTYLLKHALYKNTQSTTVKKQFYKAITWIIQYVYYVQSIYCCKYKKLNIKNTITSILAWCKLVSLVSSFVFPPYTSSKYIILRLTVIWLELFSN